MQHHSLKLKDGERIDHFKRENIQLIQSQHFFNMSVDAILLADFIQLPQQRHFHYVDFCSGNGVIPLLLSARTQNPLIGIEIQEPLIDMAQRSIALNQLQDQITMVHADIKALPMKEWRNIDIISCNPPYFIVDDTQAIHHLNSHAIARHEILLTMEQWISQASRMLKTRGKLYFVHRPNRLDDIMTCLDTYGFSVNRMKFIYPKVGMNANGVLVEAIRLGGRRGVKIEPPVIVHEADDSYTPEMQAIYYG